MSHIPEALKLRKAQERINEAKTLPTPKRLFGEFWLEGELCILFADTGKGKSILAVQIAESIARGEAIGPLQLTAQAQKVLYFDFELSAKQFEMRYAADPEEDADEFLKNHYTFSDNFYTAEIDADGEFPEDFANFEEYLRATVEKMVRSIGAKVVIIDNITYLRGANDTAREAIPLMRELKRLKKELGLSILVLAHTPKRDMARRITVNDLQGSKVLSNFADNIFAIGQSSIDASFRYVKHIKPRSTEMIYDAENVLVGEIRKWEKNFLGFRFHRFSKETDHLAKTIDPMIRERAEMVRELAEKGMSQRQIAAQYGISVGSVNRYLQMVKDSQDYFDLDDGFYYDDEEEDEGESKPVLDDWRTDPNYFSPETWIKRYGIKCIPEQYRKYYEDLYGSENGEGDAKEIPKREDWPLYDEEDVSGDKDPMARYGLAGFETGMRGAVRDVSEDEPEDEWEEPDDPPPVKYKTMDDKIEVGDIVLGPDGRLRKKTNWGWDYDVEAIE